MSRTSPYLNRVYNIRDQNATLLIMSKDLQDKAYKVLRGTINETTQISDSGTAEIDLKADVLVFNNASAALVNKSITVVSGTGKDIYDFTNKNLVEMDTDLTFLANVDGFSVSMYLFDDFDHFELDTPSTGTLFKATTTGATNFSWHDNERDGANQVTNATQRRVYLYDPSFTTKPFCNYYGWLNASRVQNWSVCSHLVIGDANNAEIDRIIGQTDILFYITVNDYAQGNATWLADKKTELDFWFALNESMDGTFLDGIDNATITNASDFEIKFKSLIDFIRITKNKRAILNTYTYSDKYATWADGIYKESCVGRWNGNNA